MDHNWNNDEQHNPHDGHSPYESHASEAGRYHGQSRSNKRPSANRRPPYPDSIPQDMCQLLREGRGIRKAGFPTTGSALYATKVRQQYTVFTRNERNLEHYKGPDKAFLLAPKKPGMYEIVFEGRFRSAEDMDVAGLVLTKVFGHDKQDTIMKIIDVPLETKFVWPLGTYTKDAAETLLGSYEIMCVRSSYGDVFKFRMEGKEATSK